jgi:hypothetical protein
MGLVAVWALPATASVRAPGGEAARMRVGDMYQNPAVRLRLNEDMGRYRSIRLRTKKPGTPEVAAFLS